MCQQLSSGGKRKMNKKEPLPFLTVSEGTFVKSTEFLEQIKTFLIQGMSLSPQWLHILKPPISLKPALYLIRRDRVWLLQTTNKAAASIFYIPGLVN